MCHCVVLCPSTYYQDEMIHVKCLLYTVGYSSSVEIVKPHCWVDAKSLWADKLKYIIDQDSPELTMTGLLSICPHEMDSTLTFKYNIGYRMGVNSFYWADLIWSSYCAAHINIVTFGFWWSTFTHLTHRLPACPPWSGDLSVAVMKHITSTSVPLRALLKKKKKKSLWRSEPEAEGVLLSVLPTTHAWSAVISLQSARAAGSLCGGC